MPYTWLQIDKAFCQEWQVGSTVVHDVNLTALKTTVAFGIRPLDWSPYRISGVCQIREHTTQIKQI